MSNVRIHNRPDKKGISDEPFTFFVKTVFVFREFCPDWSHDWKTGFFVLIEEGVPKSKREGFIGKTVGECIEQLSGKDVDAIVKIAFKRRAYKGKQKNDEMKVRLVAVYNEEEEKYHIYITNIQKDVLNAKDIAKLYGARRDIELHLRS